MKRLTTLALLAAPLCAATLLQPGAGAAAAVASSPLSQVTAHLQAVNTMTAGFTQTGRNGQSLTGNLTLKRPGQIRFQYQKGVPMLIVGDGKNLTVVDYQVRQVSRIPIGSSPMSVLLNPNQDLSRIARVTRNDDQILAIAARDPKRPQFGTINISFAKVPSAPGGLMLAGWTMQDTQRNLITVRLSGQRFNVPVGDDAFRFVDPRRSGPRG